MFDKELVIDSLQKIDLALQTICERTVAINCPDDFLLTPEGTLRLDAVCMNLIAVGESVKGLDKLTKGELLAKYPEVYWGGVMRMRDKIAHHYFELDAEVVFRTIKEEIPVMIKTIRQMLQDVQSN